MPNTVRNVKLSSEEKKGKRRRLRNFSKFITRKTHRASPKQPEKKPEVNESYDYSKCDYLVSASLFKSKRNSKKEGELQGRLSEATNKQRKVKCVLPVHGRQFAQDVKRYLYDA
eukprot:TRINITY_DN17378_c0_g1_i5.p1 TRINITY_DN17378_c0_g1~~TRINITY_DN17378_c0_g1_i5.p1  ORF type:complete len:114 (-),score=20.88 TRINITY_DN17378_c0_g1_i5:145-486(-)